MLIFNSFITKLHNKIFESSDLPFSPEAEGMLRGVGKREQDHF